MVSRSRSRRHLGASPLAPRPPRQQRELAGVPSGALLVVQKVVQRPRNLQPVSSCTGSHQRSVCTGRDFVRARACAHARWRRDERSDIFAMCRIWYPCPLRRNQRRRLCRGHCPRDVEQQWLWLYDERSSLWSNRHNNRLWRVRRAGLWRCSRCRLWRIEYGCCWYVNIVVATVLWLCCVPRPVK